MYNTHNRKANLRQCWLIANANQKKMSSVCINNHNFCIIWCKLTWLIVFLSSTVYVRA